MLSLERRGQLPEELQLNLKKQSIVDLLKDIAKRYPDQTALFAPEKQISFQELDCQSDKIAKYLLSLDIQPHCRIAVFSEPSWKLIAALFGIVKAGAAMIALDPLSQKKHITAIIEKSNPSTILAGDQQVPSYLADEIKTLNIDEILESDTQDIELPVISPQDPAYIVFKKQVRGVELTHQSAVNSIFWARSEHNFGPGDTAALIARPRCEMAIAEILNTLCNGVTVKIFPSRCVLSGSELKHWICEEKISLISLPTTTAEELLEESLDGSALRLLLTHGDQLKKPPPHSSSFQVVSQYGMAEGGVVAMEYHVKHDEESLVIPIGYPIANCKAYIFDSCFQELPHGKSGQLCLGGIGLAKGYLEEELNHDKFVIHTRIGKRPERLFLTGDLVRKRNDGKIEFLGKMDQQDSIGDSQVGLTTVESIINSHVGILHAVVIPISRKGKSSLAAYWVEKENASVSIGNLKRALKRRLPAHMVPNHWIQLSKLPIGSDGKVSTEQLPIPQEAECEDTQNEMPKNPIESQLVTLWQSTLKITPIGVHKSFFDLGASSLDAAKLLLTINQHFGKKFSATTLFEHNTIAKMALLIVDPEPPEKKALTPIRKEGKRAPLIGFYGFAHGPYCYHALAPHLPEDLPLYTLDVMDQEKSFDEMVDHAVNKIQELAPNGCCSFIGQGIGAYVAYEAASRLKKKVSFIGILDTRAPEDPKSRTLYQRLRTEKNYFFKLNKDERKTYLIRKWEAFEQKIGRFLRLSHREDPLEQVVPEELKAAEKRALSSYRPAPHDLELIIFTSVEEEKDPSLGWNKLTQKLKIKKIITSPVTFFTSPNIKAFAENLIELIP